MKSLRKIVVALVLLFALAVPAVSAATGGTDLPPRAPTQPTAGNNDFINTLFPSIDGGGIAKKYTQYPLWNYALDSDSAWYDPVTPAIMFVLNLTNVIIGFLVRLTIVIFEQAFTLDLLDMVADKVSTIVQEYKKSTWDQFSGMIMAICAFVILFNAAVSYKRSKSLQQLIISLLIIVMSTLFFAYPKQILTSVNDMSREVSAQVLSAGMPLFDKNVGSINQAVVVASNQIWEQQIKYPWYLMQFMSISEGKNKEVKFLPYSRGDNLRDDNMDKEIDAGNWIMEESGIFPRFIIVLLSLIWNVVVCTMIIVISLLVLASQLAPLALIILSPFILVLALLPYYGLTIIYKWTEQVLGALFYKVVLSIFLSLFMILSNMFFTIFDSYFMLQMVVQIVLVVMLLLYRTKILGIFTAVGKGPQAVGNAMQQPADVKGQLSRGASTAASIGMTAAGIYATGGIAKGLAAAGPRGSKLQAMGRVVDMASEAKRERAVNPHAQDLLQQRFLQQKEQADKRAEETGTSPRYNAFVRGGMDRMEQGLPTFTLEQQAQVAREMLDVKKQGGNIERMFNPTGVQASSAKTYNVAQSKHFARMDGLNRDFQSARQRRMRIVKQAEGMRNNVGGQPRPKRDDMETIPTPSDYPPIRKGAMPRSSDAASDSAQPSQAFAETASSTSSEHQPSHAFAETSALEKSVPVPAQFTMPESQEDTLLRVASMHARHGNTERLNHYMGKLDELRGAEGVNTFVPSANFPTVKPPSEMSSAPLSVATSVLTVDTVEIKPVSRVKAERQKAYEKLDTSRVQSEFESSKMSVDQYMNHLSSQRQQLRGQLVQARAQKQNEETIKNIKRDYLDATNRYHASRLTLLKDKK